jgi:hypothetical protein
VEEVVLGAVSILKAFDLQIIISITMDRDLHLNRSILKGKMNIYEQLNLDLLVGNMDRLHSMGISVSV